MPLPHQLIQQIKAGNVVLFLGAGASYGAKNIKGQSIPSANDLAQLLSEKFLGGIKGDLSYIADLSISESSLYDVQLFIREIFKEFKPTPHHLKLPEFNWKAIFTTNYDLLVEEAYGARKSNTQNLVPVFKNTPKTQIFYTESVLPYYKIHGSITDINDPEAPLILTPDQFANHSSKRDRLFTDLKELIHDYTFLFIGFGMADSDIRSVLNTLEKENANRARAYMVGPSVTEMEIRMWEGRKVTPLKMTFEDFVKEIDASIELHSRKFASLAVDTTDPIYRKFALSIDDVKPTENFLNFIKNNIDFVHPNLSATNTDPKQFYRGFFVNWDPIIKNLDVSRKMKDGILLEVFMDVDQHDSEGQYLYMLKGNAGSGKSVLLKRLAFDAAHVVDRLCIFLKEDMSISYDQIAELAHYVKERIYLFVDNVAKLEDELVLLLKKAKRDKVKLTIVGAERFNVWNTECKDLVNYLTQEFPVKYLDDKEIRDLLALLERHNALYALRSKTNEERTRAFAERAGREILVALYEATNSKPFEEIIYDEYKSINDVKAQSLYLTVSIFHKIGAETRAGFISRVHDISFHDFKEKLFKPLEYIVFDKKNERMNDFVYLTRNKLIAEIIFEKVITTPQNRFDEYVRILNHLNIDYDGDRMAFLSIVNARKLMDVFPDPEMIRKIYDLANELSEDDPKLYQQEAIFEINAKGGKLHNAEKYLKKALQLAKNDRIISHTYAEMFLRKAELAKTDREFYQYIDEALDICSALIRKGATNTHPYHTILKANILKFKKILDSNDAPATERALKEIEKVLGEARQLFINDEYLLEIESSFNSLIDEDERAKDLLEKAYSANTSSPYLALRLANYYEKSGHIDDALKTVKETLSTAPADRDLNYKYAMLLQKQHDPSYDDIKHHLRRSFTKGDSRYQSQFWYARALFLSNEIPEAREIFRSLSSINISPQIKYTPVGMIKYNGKPVPFEGTVVKLELTYGFIRRDGFSDDVFFFRDHNEEINWELLRRGVRLKFNIGFNYKGATALNVQPM